MKKLTWLLIIILCISLLPTFMPVVKATPSIWYVAIDGDDTNSGSDINHPLLTLRKAINKASNGDIIYLRGGKYTLASTLTNGIYINRTGTKAQPFTIATYPSDLASGNKAILDGRLITLSSYYGILQFEYKTGVWPNNVTINGISIENSSRDGIYVAGGSTGKCNDIIINDCRFNNISLRALSFLQFNVATKGCLENITVANCTFWNIQASISIGESVTFGGVKNFVFENNVFLWTRKIALDLTSQTSHGVVRNNNFHLNESELNGYGPTSAVHMNGMDKNDKTVSYIDVYNNVIWGTASTGASINGVVLSGETATGHDYNITIYNNIINVTCDDGEAANGIKLFDDSEDHSAYVYYNNITIKHNTIYCRNSASSSSIVLNCVPVATHDLIIANNILIGGGTSSYQISSLYLNSTDPELTYVNNAFYHTGKTSATSFPDGTGKFGTGYIRIPYPIVNPVFVSIATYDFHLDQNSAVIDKASPTYSVATDYDGIERPQLSGYDMGAYEYNGGTSGDSTIPVISQVDVITSIPIDTQAGYGWENITCVVTDNVGVSTVLLIFTNPDLSITYVPMIKKTVTTTYYGNQSLHQSGNYSYYIQAIDTSNNVALSSSYTFLLLPNWDINYDGVVTILDLVLVSNQYDKTGDSGWIREDIDNNGKIQVLDLTIISSHFGES